MQRIEDLLRLKNVDDNTEVLSMPFSPEAYEVLCKLDIPTLGELRAFPIEVIRNYAGTSDDVRGEILAVLGY